MSINNVYMYINMSNVCQAVSESGRRKCTLNPVSVPSEEERERSGERSARLREEESEVQLSSANAESSARNKNDHLLILPLFHTCTMSLRSEKGRSFTCS